MEKSLKEKLEVVRTDVQNLIKEAEGENQSWDSDDEDAANPWEEIVASLHNADSELEDAINAIPAE